MHVRCFLQQIVIYKNKLFYSLEYLEMYEDTLSQSSREQEDGKKKPT